MSWMGWRATKNWSRKTTLFSVLRLEKASTSVLVLPLCCLYFELTTCSKGANGTSAHPGNSLDIQLYKEANDALDWRWKVGLKPDQTLTLSM
jgi:hypothetical protein